MIILTMIIIVSKLVPLPEITFSLYFLIILGITTILIIIFSINLYKIKHEEKINIPIDPLVGKIYDIEKIIKCFSIHTNNQRFCFIIKGQILNEELKQIGDKAIIFAWFKKEYLSKNNEPPIGIYKTTVNPNTDLGPIDFKPYYGKK